MVEPFAAFDVNAPGEIEILVAPVVYQLSRLDEPAVIEVGYAVKERIEGAEADCTVTVAVAVTCPPGPVAVNV